MMIMISADILMYHKNRRHLRAIHDI